MTRPLLAAAVLTLAAGCGSNTSSDGQPPAASPASPPSSLSPVSSPSAMPLHSPLLESDTDQRFTAVPGTVFFVRLAPSTGWGPLTASSGEVEEVLYRTDPGFREWQVTLPAHGEVTLTSTCAGCADQQGFRVVILVG